MPYVLRVITFANGAPCPVEGEYLQEFNFEAGDGLGYGLFTCDLTKAKRFATAAAAMRFWNTQSKVRPIRPDGRPNKPLTATTMDVIRIDAVDSK